MGARERTQAAMRRLKESQRELERALDHMPMSPGDVELANAAARNLEVSIKSLRKAVNDDGRV